MNKLKEFLVNYTLLYVEDEESLRESTKNLLNKFSPKVDIAKDGKEGLALYEKNHYDIVITDISMPEMDGLEMSKRIKEIDRHQPIIIISAYSDFEKLMETIKIGLDAYLIKPLDLEHLINALEKVSLNIKHRQDSEYYKHHLEDLVQKKVNEILNLEYEKSKNYEETILALVNMVEIRDSYTSGHSQRVAEYSKLIAIELGLDDEEIEKVYQSGILHDIGKIAIPDSILLKPNKLSDGEFNLMKKHALMSSEIIDKIPMYKDLSIYVKHHHERYDGSGYPDGLKGDKTPLLSQIMAIADSFDAMTTSRIYKPRKEKEEAILELQSLVNISFSKSIVEAAVKVFSQIDVDSNINQDPLTEFEEQRFSFFYKDKLTDLYNGDYLDLVLNTANLREEYNYMTVIDLHNFSKINKLQSWEKGNKILVEFSKYLKKNFSGCLIFRFRGDDFILLDKKEFKEVDILLLEKYHITISIEKVNIIEENIHSQADLKPIF